MKDLLFTPKLYPPEAVAQAARQWRRAPRPKLARGAQGCRVSFPDAGAEELRRLRGEFANAVLAAMREAA